VSVDERRKALERIVRLREAEEHRTSPSVSWVREELEADLGGTVSRALAADFLGVSHTALNRWIASGDVPAIITATGRTEVPIPVLSELRARVEREGESGRRRLHKLEPAMVESRKRAERLRPDPSLLTELESGETDRHRLTELRSLAYHRTLAPRLRRPMIDRARAKLDHWEREDRIDPGHAAVWRELLGRPLDEIRAAIGADDPAGRDLRQNSPLAGLISEPERRKILESVKAGAQS
jgi:hypothetical protein